MKISRDAPVPGLELVHVRAHGLLKDRKDVRAAEVRKLAIRGLKLALVPDHGQDQRARIGAASMMITAMKMMIAVKNIASTGVADLVRPRKGGIRSAAIIGQGQDQHHGPLQGQDPIRKNRQRRTDMTGRDQELILGQEQDHVRIERKRLVNHGEHDRILIPAEARQ